MENPAPKPLGTFATVAPGAAQYAIVRLEVRSCHLRFAAASMPSAALFHNQRQEKPLQGSSSAASRAAFACHLLPRSHRLPAMWGRRLPAQPARHWHCRPSKWLQQSAPSGSNMLQREGEVVKATGCDAAKRIGDAHQAPFAAAPLRRCVCESWR